MRFSWFISCFPSASFYPTSENQTVTSVERSCCDWRLHLMLENCSITITPYRSRLEHNKHLHWSIQQMLYVCVFYRLPKIRTLDLISAMFYHSSNIKSTWTFATADHTRVCSCVIFFAALKDVKKSRLLGRASFCLHEMTNNRDERCLSLKQLF